MIDHRQAQRLLDDEVFQSAMAGIRKDLTEDWQRSRPDDAAGREKLFQQLQAIERLEEKLKSYVLNGKMAERR